MTDKRISSTAILVRSGKMGELFSKKAIVRGIVSLHRRIPQGLSTSLDTMFSSDANTGQLSAAIEDVLAAATRPSIRSPAMVVDPSDGEFLATNMAGEDVELEYGDTLFWLPEASNVYKAFVRFTALFRKCMADDAFELRYSRGAFVFVKEA